MISSQEYIQLKAFARQDGTFMGLLWIVSFACFLISQTHTTMSFVFDLTIISIPFFAASRAKNFRDYALGGTISFGRALAYLLLLFGYAILLFALAQWAYFQFIDGGRLVGGMVKTVNSPEFKAVLDAYQISKAELEQSMKTLSEARPVDFAVTFIWMNMFACMLMSWVIALLTKRSVRNA